MHLVFYDGRCGMCDQCVQFLLKVDNDKIFSFAPLQGITAAEKLAKLPDSIKDADSIILIENYGSTDEHIYIFGKAIFRILWLLGGSWKVLGSLSFLPGFLYNWGYKLVARNRHLFFKHLSCIVPNVKDKQRFLP